jgi:hypothetical protein
MRITPSMTTMDGSTILPGGQLEPIHLSGWASLQMCLDDQASGRGGRFIMHPTGNG